MESREVWRWAAQRAHDYSASLSDGGAGSEEAIGRQRRTVPSPLPAVRPDQVELPSKPESAIEADGASAVMSAGSAAPASAKTVFVSWAHAHSSWTSEQAQEWERHVAEFTTMLRQLGLDADVDLYHLHDGDVDWTRFGPSKIIECDFVLVVMSEAWKERWAGQNRPTEGAGAAAEADALKGLYQQHQRDWHRKIKIVLLPGQGVDSIPADMMRLVRFAVDPSEPSTFDDLLRTLSAQPKYPKPDLGQVPSLPAGVSRRLPTTRRRGNDPIPTDYKRLTLELEKADRALRDPSISLSQRDHLYSRRATLQGIMDALNQWSAHGDGD